MYSYKLISQDDKFDPAAAYGALQHHEKLNGSGYPQKLKGSQITQDAKILSVADVYDALTSERPFRDRLEPYEAMKIIISGNGTLFYPNVVSAFVKVMSLYPVESFVKLSSGELAIVTRSSKKSAMMPVVRVIIDISGNKVRDSEEIDLNYDTRYISGPISRTSELLRG